MTEPKPWGTYKEVVEVLGKKIKEDPEAFEWLEKNPYMFLRRKPDAKVYTIPNTREEFITRVKALLKEYNAELEWSRFYDESEPMIIIKEGYTVSLDDLFEEGE